MEKKVLKAMLLGTSETKIFFTLPRASKYVVTVVVTRNACAPNHTLRGVNDKVTTTMQ